MFQLFSFMLFFLGMIFLFISLGSVSSTGFVLSLFSIIGGLILLGKSA